MTFLSFEKLVLNSDPCKSLVGIDVGVVVGVVLNFLLISFGFHWILRFEGSGRSPELQIFVSLDQLL